MKYVLIFMLLTQEFGSVSVTAEFDDKPACTVALEALRETQSRAFDSEPHNGYLVGECYPKGSK